MKKNFQALILIGFLALFTADVQGAPISYEAQLFDGITISGVNNQPAGNASNPVGAVYYSFHAVAASPVTIYGDRLAGHYDMSFWVYRGLYADTSAFGASFDTGDPGYIAFGDDQDPANIPGPFGDPRVAFNAPGTDFYTVAVTNFSSNAGPPNPFELTANGVNAVNAVPEPTTMLLLGSGLLGLWGARRKFKK